MTNEQKLVTAAESRKLIDKPSPQLQAMILLGLNCGFGQQDCALVMSFFWSLAENFVANRIDNFQHNQFFGEQL